MVPMYPAEALNIFFCFCFEDDVLGMLLNIEEDKVVFYLNGVAIPKRFPAKGR